MTGTEWDQLFPFASGLFGDFSAGRGSSGFNGKKQFGINTSAAQLAAAGFGAFSLFGANGYRNGALFWSIHVSGQYGRQLASSGPFTHVRAHIDIFNPGARFPLNLLGIPGHRIVDLEIGTLFFGHSSRLDPGCH